MEAEARKFDLCIANNLPAMRNHVELAFPARMLCRPVAAASIATVSPSVVRFEEEEAARLRREAEEERRRLERQNTPVRTD